MSNQLVTFFGWSIVPSVSTRRLYIEAFLTQSARDKLCAKRILWNYNSCWRSEARTRIALIRKALSKNTHLTDWAVSALHSLRSKPDIAPKRRLLPGSRHSPRPWREGDQEPLSQTVRGSPVSFDTLSSGSHALIPVTNRAALHHPDKVAATGRQPVSEDYFVHIKLAQDTLLDPVHRFAYDRFGPDMLAWQHCSTIGDYLAVGLRAYAPTYIGSGIVMIILSATGWLKWGRFVCITL